MQTDILKKKMEINTFLIISDDSVNENKGLLKKHADVWEGTKNTVKTINSGECNSVKKMIAEKFT